MPVKNLKKLCTFIVLLCVVSIYFPNFDITFAANPNISIETEQDTFDIGDEFSATYKIDPQDNTISSISLSFTYNSQLLEFQDSDINTPGIQISQSSSAFTTVTKRVVSPNSNEINFSASKIGGISEKSIIFKAIFKVLEKGQANLNLDKTISKVFNNDGLIDFDFLEKNINLSTTETNNDPESIIFNVNHSSKEQGLANQDNLISIGVEPKDQVKEIRLYVKNSIDPSFTPFPMTLGEDNSFHVLIPKEKAIIGEIQYFFGIIDINDEPHRYPAADDIFYSLGISLEPINTDPTNPGPTIENPINNENTNITPPVYNKPTSITYNNTTNTGPEHIIFIIIAGIIGIGYAVFSERKKIST